MAHLNVRKRQTKSGLKWIVTQAEWASGQNKVVERKLTETVLSDLGFSVNMTPAQAQAHAKKLNALDAIKRKEQTSKVRASERLHDLALIENSIIPVELSELFVAHMSENWFGGEYNLRKQVQHWAKVQAIITKLNVQPHEYFKRKNEFYKEFESLRMSKSYIEKILKVINMWGEYYAEQTKSFFKKLPSPRGIVLEKIKESSMATGLGARPMTLEILDYMKNKMPSGQWEYIRATLWLGLRPSELDAIIENRAKNLKTESQRGTKIVGIYQAKLTGVSKDMRWKHIPLIHPEQMAALKDINSEVVIKPLVKTIRNYAPSDATNLGLYSGRKGFTDLMLELGQSLEDISQWMGHASVERTWRHYKNKRRVNFKKLG